MRRVLVVLTIVATDFAAAYIEPRAQEDPGEAKTPYQACLDSCAGPFIDSHSDTCGQQIDEITQNKCYCENGLVGVVEQCNKNCTPAEGSGTTGTGAPLDLLGLTKDGCAALEKNASIVVVGNAGNGTGTNAVDGGSNGAGDSTADGAGHNSGNGVGDHAGIIYTSVLALGTAALVVVL
ncbi:hypothetical protein AURDEDRAFT_129757 [Auricularia subglabra TFB-10046 SS5]|uniref:Extracellular membrane protein CFEM domain-containing protein n=1 Tax=Auricularia subglabra (strain TFB-10046 / SS5) TaxID=717982 RepID=J0LH09_AURST|nr:hypothetical protein AURDEDRAFT_129757 [Auricularia subglabra TFB-10046 SS5]